MLKYRWFHAVHRKLAKILQGTGENGCEIFEVCKAFLLQPIVHLQLKYKEQTNN
jgi:hypothetical protein